MLPEMDGGRETSAGVGILVNKDTRTRGWPPLYDSWPKAGSHEHHFRKGESDGDPICRLSGGQDTRDLQYCPLPDEESHLQDPADLHYQGQKTASCLPRAISESWHRNTRTEG